MTNFYLTGTLSGLSATAARQLAHENAPAIARPLDRADWYVAFLATSPRQGGQTPFSLTGEEADRLRPRPPSCEEVCAALLAGEFREMSRNESMGWQGAAEGGRVWDWRGLVQVCASFHPGEGLRVDACGEHGQWTYDLAAGAVEEV